MYAHTLLSVRILGIVYDTSLFVLDRLLECRLCHSTNCGRVAKNFKATARMTSITIEEIKHRPSLKLPRPELRSLRLAKQADDGCHQLLKQLNSGGCWCKEHDQEHRSHGCHNTPHCPQIIALCPQIIALCRQ
jgi:hypothetical protein